MRERRAMADYLLANEPRHRTDLALVTVSRDPQALNDLVAGREQPPHPSGSSSPLTPRLVPQSGKRA